MILRQGLVYIDMVESEIAKWTIFTIGKDMVAWIFTRYNVQVI